MCSLQFWLRLLPVIGLLKCCVSVSLHSKDYIKVPLNYQDAESNRYDKEVIEYDIVDQKLRMWDEEDHVIDLSRSKGSGRNGGKPRFATISSRTEIPDQDELDQVDEGALKRGHQTITVDKDNEVLTEVIDDGSPPNSLPVTSTVLPSVSIDNSTKDHSLTNTTLQNTQPTVIENSFNGSGNTLPNTALTSGNVATNSTEYSATVGNNSSLLQKDANSSFSSMSREKNSVNSVGRNLENSSQNSNLPDAESAPSLVQLPVLDSTKSNSTNNSLGQNSSNIMPPALSQSSYTKIDNESPLVNTATENIAMTTNDGNLTDSQNRVEILHSNDRNKSTDNIISADVTEIVDSADNNIFFKGAKESYNISDTKQSTDNNRSNASPLGSSLKTNINGDAVSTNTSNIGQTSAVDTNGKKNVTLEKNSSFPAFGISETDKNTVNKLDQKLDSLLNSRKNWSNESQEIKSFSTGNSSRSLLPLNVRRMNIIHHDTLNHEQNKTARKVQSFLTAVKEMFKEPESAEDILAWEAWGPCSRTCGKGAVKMRQRKCEKLVARDFDVACPEPRKQTEKCPVVSCSVKHRQEPLPESMSFGGENDKKDVDDMSTKHRHRTQDGGNLHEVVGTENDINQDNSDDSVTSRPSSEDQSEDDEISTEDSGTDPEGYGESSEQQYPSNVASVQTANQKRYLYTVWGPWSSCTRTCGQRAYTFRKRFCINAVTGEIKRHCQRPTILAKKCVLTPCPVDGGLSDWSKWSSCSGTCGIMERHRSCTKPKPAFGGRECFKLPVQMRLCGTCHEGKVAAVQNLASYSPKALCGFDPCQRVGCLEEKGAICVTDFDCNPTFFDDEGNVLKRCKVPAQLFLRPLAQKKCSFNPCSFAKCDVRGAKCLVDTKCRPFFVNEMGNKVNCKGSNVLQISSELICGFNPCKITTCTVDPEAKCVTDYRCNPIFINAAGQKISGCTEDELEAAQRFTSSRPSAGRETTENPSARDLASIHYHNPYLQPLNVQKSRDESSVKKTISSQLLEKILARRLHHEDNLDSENETYPRNSKNGYTEDEFEKNAKNVDDAYPNQSDITLLQDIFARSNRSKPSKSENATNSGNLSTSSKNHGKQATKASGVKLLKIFLQHRLHPHKSLDSKNSAFSEKSIRFQESTNNKIENDSQNLEHGDDGRNASTGLVEDANKKSQNKLTDAYSLPTSNEQVSNDGIKLKTLHQDTAETTEMVDSSSFLDDSVGSEKDDEVSEMKEVLDKPLTNEDSIESSEKAFPSTQGESKGLAEVDRFILDKFYKKKMMEDASKPSLNHEQGKISFNANEMNAYTKDDSEVNKNETDSASITNNNIYNTNNNINNNNSNNHNNKGYNNFNIDHNKNLLNNKIALKAPATPPTIISRPQPKPPQPKPPQPNITIHYNLGVPKIDSKFNPPHSNLSKPQMPKFSLGKKQGDSKIQEKIISLENNLANMKKINGAPVILDDQNQEPQGKHKFGQNELDAKLKLVDEGKVVPGHGVVMVAPESGQSGITGHRLPVIHSSDPNLEISPYDDEVTYSALEKEESENPAGIPTKSELSGLLNPAFGTKLKDSNRESDVMLETSEDKHRYPLVSTAVPSLPPPLQASQVTNKPVNRVTNIQSNLIKKLVLKAVQRELAKLKLDGIVEDARKSIKHEARKGLNQAAKIFTPNQNTGHLGVNKKPSDNHPYLGLSKGHHGLGRLGLKTHAGQTGGKVFFSTPKPFHSEAVSTSVPIFQDEKDGNSYDGQSNDAEGVGQLSGGGKGSSKQGRAREGTEHKEDESVETNDHQSDVESLQEIEDFLKYSEDGKTTAKPEQTTAKPEQITSTPEENNNRRVETSNGYTITLDRPTEGDTDGHVVSQRISKVNNGDHEEIKEREYKTSYSPSLVNEIKELGLHEYYIKDGFETPRVPKFDNGQVRHVLKSHRWREDTDNPDSHKNHHHVGYKKKFHLAQIEMQPNSRGYSHLRQHNSDGDEIERVPDNYREGDGVARSHDTNGKIEEDSEENDDILREPGASHVGSLTKSLAHLSQYVDGIDSDLLDSGLNTKNKNVGTEGDLGNAIVLTAKDDGNAGNYIEDEKTPKIQNHISQKDVLFADGNESDKNDLEVFKIANGDGNYRRTLKLRSGQTG